MRFFSILLILAFSLHAKSAQQEFYLATELFQAMDNAERTAFTEYIRKHIAMAVQVAQKAQTQANLAPIAECIQQKLYNSTITVQSSLARNCAGTAAYIARGGKGTIFICPRAWGATSFDNTVLTLIHEASHLCNQKNNEIETELVTIKLGLAAYTAGMKNFMVQCQPNYCSKPALANFTQKNNFSQIFSSVEKMPEYLARRKYREDFFKQWPHLHEIRMLHLK